MFGALGEIDLSDPIEWDHPLNAGLVSAWLPLSNRMGSGTLYDLCGRNHGTLVNGPTWTAGPNGFGALTFNGSNQYATVANDATMNSGGGPLTLSATIRVAATGVTQVIAGRGSNNSPYPQEYYLYLTPANKMLFQSDANSYAAATSTTTFAAGVLYHVVGTYTGSVAGRTRTIYVNGVPEDSIANTTDPNYSSGLNGFLIGNQKDATAYFGGDVLEVGYWSRALSMSEVASLYDQSRRGYPDLLRRGPTARWFVGAGGTGGTSYPLSLAATSRALTTTSATPRAARYMVAASSTRALAPTAAAARAARAATLASTTRALTPTNATARASRVASLASATRTLTAIATALGVARSLGLASAARGVTATPVTAAYRRGMALATVTRDLTPTAAVVARNRVAALAAVSRGITVTGVAATAARKLDLNSVSRFMSRPSVVLTSDAGGIIDWQYIFNTVLR